VRAAEVKTAPTWRRKLGRGVWALLVTAAIARVTKNQGAEKTNES
jgi:hypothetical protein